MGALGRECQATLSSDGGEVGHSLGWGGAALVATFLGPAGGVRTAGRGARAFPLPCSVSLGKGRGASLCPQEADPCRPLTGDGWPAQSPWPAPSGSATCTL